MARRVAEEAKRRLARLEDTAKRGTHPASYKGSPVELEQTLSRNLGTETRIRPDRTTKKTPEPPKSTRKAKRYEIMKRVPEHEMYRYKKEAEKGKK